MKRKVTYTWFRPGIDLLKFGLMIVLLFCFVRVPKTKKKIEESVYKPLSVYISPKYSFINKVYYTFQILYNLFNL